MMKKILLSIGMIALMLPLSAQAHMRIHHKGGGHSDVPIAQIDSITFVDSDDMHVEEVKLTGSWLWGNAETGYYESLTFNKDKTYTCYDNYFIQVSQVKN